MWPLAIVLFLLAGAAYLSTLSGNFATELEFFTLAREVEGKPCPPDGLTMMHPLWVPLGKLAWKAALLLGFSDGAFRPLQVFDALISALAIALFFIILARLTRRPALSVLIALCLASTSYWWIISVQMRPYSFGLLMLLLSFFLLAFRNDLTALIGSALACALAALTHVTAYFFLPAALTLIFMKNKPAWKKWADSLLFLGVVAISIFLFFLFFRKVAAIPEQSLHPASYLQSALTSFTSSQAGLKLLLEHPLNLFGAFLWSYASLKSCVPQTVWMLVFNIISAITTLFVAMCLLLFLSCLTLIVRRKSGPSSEMLSLALWAACTFGVLFFFDPINFAVTYANFALFGLLGLLISRLGSLWRRVACLALILFFVALSALNAPFFISERNNQLSETLWRTARAFQAGKVIRREDAVICLDIPLSAYLEYETLCRSYDPRWVIQDGFTGLSALDRLIESSEGRLLYLKPPAGTPSAFDSWMNLSPDRLDAECRLILAKKYRFRLLLAPEGQDLYILDPQRPLRRPLNRESRGPVQEKPGGKEKRPLC